MNILTSMRMLILTSMSMSIITSMSMNTNIPTSMNTSMSTSIPTGITIQLAREELGDCLNRDDIHLSLSLGRFAAACTWCEFLTGKSIIYNTYWPNDVSNYDVRMIHKAAHEAIKLIDDFPY